MGLLTANPCDALERPRAMSAPARGYSADEVRRLLAIVPDTVRGRRDRAVKRRTSEAAWDQGRAMTMDEAMALALESPSEAPG